MQKSVKQEQNIKMSEPISIVAHQLKNPISVLTGYLEVLLSESLGNINGKQREYLNDAIEILSRVQLIISDLLDVSRIEEHQYKLNNVPFDLSKITEEVLNDFSSWTKASNCEISFVSRKLPYVMADRIKIRQVLESLISNAIKYKLSGLGKIKIDFKKSGKNIIFSCKDNGIGIPIKDYSKVFSKFYRSEEAMKIDPSGVGLGLYIDKAIINISKGRLWFQKNKDGGMTFHFSLPIA